MYTHIHSPTNQTSVDTVSVFEVLFSFLFISFLSLTSEVCQLPEWLDATKYIHLNHLLDAYAPIDIIKITSRQQFTDSDEMNERKHKHNKANGLKRNEKLP